MTFGVSTKSHADLEITKNDKERFFESSEVKVHVDKMKRW